MGKIIFIDVDGTLVDYETNLPDSAVEAIRKARKNGHNAKELLTGYMGENWNFIWRATMDCLPVRTLNKEQIRPQRNMQSEREMYSQKR